LISPVSRIALEQILEGCDIPAFQFDEEPTLAEGQAFLRMGRVERQIDLSGVTERMTQAITSLFELNERKLKHAG
jgi:flagellar assembly protein FliH